MSVMPEAAATESTSALRDVRVLLDGRNAELVHGTGIKNYTMGVARALKGMKARLGMVLSVRIMAPREKKRLETTLVYTHKHRRTRRWKLTLDWILSAAKVPLSTRPVDIEEYRKVWEPGAYPFEDIALYSRGTVFGDADRRFKKYKIPTVLDCDFKPQIWHCTMPLPIRVKGALKVTTLHDIIPLRLPESCLSDTPAYIKLINETIRSSDLIVSVSEFTKTDVCAAFDVDPGKIVTTHQPASPFTFLPEHGEEELRHRLSRHGLSKDGYILFNANIEPKKNVGRLLSAYAVLDTECDLVIAGRKAWLWEDELRPLNRMSDAKKKKVRMLDYVAEEDLLALYRGARVFLFPSLYEGFGLPALDAMKLGVPVITSTASSLPEVCGNAAEYVDPYETAEIGRALEKVLGDAALRRQMIGRGLVQAAAFEPEKVFQKLHDAYARLLHGGMSRRV